MLHWAGGGGQVGLGLTRREDGMLPWAGFGQKCREDWAMPVATSPALQMCWCVPVPLPAPRTAGLEAPGPSCNAGAIPAVAAGLMISDSSRWGQVWRQSPAE